MSRSAPSVHSCHDAIRVEPEDGIVANVLDDRPESRLPVAQSRSGSGPLDRFPCLIGDKPHEGHLLVGPVADFSVVDMERGYSPAAAKNGCADNRPSTDLAKAGVQGDRIPSRVGDADGFASSCLLQVACPEPRRRERAGKRRQHSINPGHAGIEINGLVVIHLEEADPICAEVGADRRSRRGHHLPRIVGLALSLEQAHKQRLPGLTRTHPALGEDLLRRLGADDEHAAHAGWGILLVNRAVAVGPVDLLDRAVAKDRDKLVDVPGGAIAAHHLVDLRTDDVPDLTPGILPGGAEDGRVLFGAE